MISQMATKKTDAERALSYLHAVSSEDTNYINIAEDALAHKTLTKLLSTVREEGRMETLALVPGGYCACTRKLDPDGVCPSHRGR